MANPVNVKWQGPSTYTDGVAYTQTDHGGYDIELNGVVLVSVPFAWAATAQYSYPVANLTNLRQGNNSLRVRTVAASGQVSNWTAPVTFPYLSIPQAPTNLVVV
jgi:hypothetical protein